MQSMYPNNIWVATFFFSSTECLNTRLAVVVEKYWIINQVKAYIAVLCWLSTAGTDNRVLARSAATALWKRAAHMQCPSMCFCWPLCFGLCLESTYQLHQQTTKCMHDRFVVRFKRDKHRGQPFGLGGQAVAADLYMDIAASRSLTGASTTTIYIERNFNKF